jgi:2-dehydro-3-deoxyphosphogluconate aldolase / (4S)-4-hydroxy-2-oxoglutarate aldolase
MPAPEWLALIQQHRAIAVIRARQLEPGYQMAKAVAVGGMRLIEITWDSDRPAALIARLQAELPDCVIGTGTILTLAQMQAAIAARAAFIFMPHTHPILIQTAVAHCIPCIPGALTPTEIVTAWQAGASSVKVFPVQALGGAAYIRSLQSPLGAIPLIPTGGVRVGNAAELIAAGAIGVGLAGDLFPQSALQTENWPLITQQAQTLLQNLADYRANP